MNVQGESGRMRRMWGAGAVALALGIVLWLGMRYPTPDGGQPVGVQGVNVRTERALVVENYITDQGSLSVLGTTELGAIGSGNYAQFETDGTLELLGDARGWEDLRIDGLSTRVGVVAPTDETGFRGNANFYSRNFVHTQADEVQFSVQLPHAWQEGTTVYPHVHFSPWIANAGDAAVQFILECYDASITGTFPASSTVYTMTETWNGSAQWSHLLAGGESGYSLTGKTISAVQKCRLYRDNTVTNNLAGKAALLYIDWHYEVDTPAGSREALSK